MDKITVVTVAYNAEKDIEFTMRSVLGQSYVNLEYLVIDGKSEDKTVEIANQIKNSYKNENTVDIKIYSEKDSGIYDAMNKAIDIATGEWMIFMNAGDEFFSADVISTIFSKHYEENIKGVYGNTERFADDWNKTIIAHPLEEIRTGLPLPFCHQSVFVRTSILKEIKFDTNYKQAADYNFFMQCFLKNYKFEKRNIVVSRYAMGGISETNTVFHLKEKIMIREVNGIERYTPAKKCFIVLKLQIKQYVKNIIPPRVLKKIRGY
jgi:glycosyltransferase involved in cell wall biosynthesis